MNILSIDASTHSTGFAYFEEDKLLEQWNETAASTDVIKRIQKMQSFLEQILQTHKVDIIVLEDVRTDGVFAKSTTWKALAYLQASFAFLLHDKYPRIRIEQLQANSWRSKCGIKTGAGVKRETLKPKDIQFVKDTYDIEVNDDIADAIGIGHAQIHNVSNEINWE